MIEMRSAHRIIFYNNIYKSNDLFCYVRFYMNQFDISLSESSYSSFSVYVYLLPFQADQKVIHEFFYEPSAA